MRPYINTVSALDAETRAKLSKQQRNASILSFFVGILLMVFLALLFWLFKTFQPIKKTEIIVTYSVENILTPTVEEKKIVPKIQRKPVPPAATAVAVITHNAPAEVSLPTPEIELEELSFDFGETEDFGDGWGKAETKTPTTSNNSSGGTPTFSFMGQKAKLNETCFVIDWSRSIPRKKGRMQLLQDEMLDTLKQIPNGTNFQMIMYAGPRWTITDKFDPTSNSNRGSSITIIDPYDRNKKYKYKGVKNSLYKIEKGRGRVPKWLKMNKEIRKKIKNFIEDAEFSHGTNWQAPLEMAMRMKPKPKEIIFLTDGFVHNADEVALEIISLAKKHKVKINTVALMQSKAENALKQMSKETKGSFTLVTGTDDEDRNTIDFSR